MNPRLAALLALVAPLAVPALAMAAEKEKGTIIPSWQQGLPAAIAVFFAVGVVFTVLRSKAWPLISKGLDERSAKIREEIESAERARQQARDALAQYEKSLAEARAEAQRMLDHAKAEQQALAAELRARAEAEVAQLREKAMRDLELAKRAALNELYTESANLATTVAGKILRREVSASDTQRLVDESLDQIGASRN